MFEKYGEEKIYAFALYSDEGAMTVCPSTNTLKHLNGIDSNQEDFTYYKFEPAEWKYEMQGADKLFNEISELCSDEISKMEEDDEIYDREFDKFQKKLYDTCIEVLKKLKSENFFKQIVGEDIFLIFTVSEYEFDKNELEKIITQLNENEYKEEYLNWMQTWQEGV
ncbi:DUF4303 domain-containing protein [Dysgonomonas sp. ZJ709]|uniref:DUF4303 domain-containing protein n=1 Tax=Dysgonomonas sp. ZJ709 TaxID=2709797 RepID=UPI001C8776AC|nr:DUF4303 domain-containing protein [Dysgonomonas sp. ZJ709]